MKHQDKCLRKLHLDDGDLLIVSRKEFGNKADFENLHRSLCRICPGKAIVVMAADDVHNDVELKKAFVTNLEKRFREKWENEK